MKPTIAATISKTDNEQVLRLILRFPCLFALGSFEYMLMLLVSTNTIRTTNQMSEKKCWFLFTLLNRYIDLPVAENQ